MNANLNPRNIEIVVLNEEFRNSLLNKKLPVSELIPDAESKKPKLETTGNFTKINGRKFLGKEFESYEKLNGNYSKLIGILVEKFLMQSPDEARLMVFCYKDNSFPDFLDVRYFG